MRSKEELRATFNRLVFMHAPPWLVREVMGDLTPEEMKLLDEILEDKRRNIEQVFLIGKGITIGCVIVSIYIIFLAFIGG